MKPYSPNAIVMEKDTIYYPNGAIVKMKKGHHVYTKYSNGDQVWFKPIGETIDDDRSRVIKLKTHDGLYWEEGMKRVIAMREFWISLIPLSLLILMVVYVVVKNLWF
jgi:hypothetical protein